MKLKHSLLSWLVLGFLCVGCGDKDGAPAAAAEEPATDEKLHWLIDFEAAKAQARSENKMLLINFTGSDWCPPCIQLEKALFAKPEFAQYAAKSLVLLEVDFPRRKKLPEEQAAANHKLAGAYGIEGFPTIIVLDSDAKPLGKFGYVPGLGPTQVIEALEKARAEQ